MIEVSVIVPCYNEERTITGLLDSLLGQTYPLDMMEVIIADGNSDDHTLQLITSFLQANPRLQIKVIDNPARSIPAALNSAIRISSGEFIVRLDAHSKPYPDYIARSIADLKEGIADNVGGVWEIMPGAEGWIARSIALVASHPLAVGDAYYRFTSRAAYVDTVPFGAFRRDQVEKIGWFNETLKTNEDYEFNNRIRTLGGKVWLDPRIRSIYYARSNLRDLSRQYWRYGFWKFKMLQQYPGSLKWRQALPPLFALSLLAFGLLAVFIKLAAFVLLTELLCYLSVLLVTAFLISLKQKKIAIVLGVPLAIATMHLSWGGGFLGSVLQFNPIQD